jgi:hypothetical protein
MNDTQRYEILASYIEQRGWHVELSKGEEDEMHPQPKLIVIDAAQSPRSRVYALLHEVGHALQPGEGALFSSGFWGQLEIELDAWVRGWKVAQELNLELPLRGYRREAAKWLRTYL